MTQRSLVSDARQDFENRLANRNVTGPVLENGTFWTEGQAGKGGWPKGPEISGVRENALYGRPFPLPTLPRRRGEPAGGPSAEVAAPAAAPYGEGLPMIQPAGPPPEGQIRAPDSKYESRMQRILEILRRNAASTL